ncbi:hypothetical protein MIDIC_430004 [Alphaproteobacteria bacterium]
MQGRTRVQKAGPMNFEISLIKPSKKQKHQIAWTFSRGARREEEKQAW